jgi:hypothetical protein
MRTTNQPQPFKSRSHISPAPPVLEWWFNHDVHNPSYGLAQFSNGGDGW